VSTIRIIELYFQIATLGAVAQLNAGGNNG
jgi:hypothetical protein